MDYNSKLCVLGTFDTIGSRVAPIVHAQCALALRICFRAEDEGSHKLAIRMINEDGTDIMQPLEANIDIRLPEGTDFLTRNMILNFQPLRFETAGTYFFEIGVGGKVLSTVPLRVIVIDQQQEAIA